MSSSDANSIDNLIGGALVLGAVVLLVAIVVAVYAATAFLSNTWRVYARFNGTREGAWLWWALAAFAGAVVLALCLAILSPAAAAWLAALAFCAWALTTVAIDVAAGPDTRFLGSGDLLAPWRMAKPVV